MSNQYYDGMIVALKGYFDEKGLLATEENPTIFLNDKKAAEVEYDAEKSMFYLKVADISEGSAVDFRVASSWLFNETRAKDDTKVIAEDFMSVLDEELGLKTNKKVTNMVTLPKAQKGETPNLEALTKSVLDIFPEFKETYKSHVELYGQPLYVEFLKNTATPKLKEAAEKNNKRLLKKYCSMLTRMYNEGETVVGDMVVTVIFGGAFFENAELFENAVPYIDSPSLVASVRYMIKHIQKNTKLKRELSM